jgi:hypothetical protein
MTATPCQTITSVLVTLILAMPLSAAEYFVATNGSDGNLGTEDHPFASIARGQQAASPGDTVWIRGGVYEYTAGLGASANAVLFNKSGTSGQPINYFAYPGEIPVFDFYNYLPQERIRGFSVQADWLHFKGLELRGVQQTITNVNESWAIRVEGSGGGDNNVFEQLNLHHNEGPGLFILNGGNNLVLNCDSHDNYDPDRGGENADGFGGHSDDDGNVFVGDRAWNNSDDGFDLINSPGVETIENCWSWHNGYIPGTNTAAGNGAGIKAGGFLLDSSKFPAPGDVPRHVIEGNLSFDNRVQGFYANHHPGGIDFLNNTAFDNPRGFDLINDVDPDTWPADHYLRNNISFSNSTNLANANQALIDDEFNTWNGFPVSGRDFVSLSTAGVDGPRLADGSLPYVDFMRLVAGSGVIDAGQYVGLPYLGAAPDLGAFEYRFPGDYNDDGVVDAADYTVWRDALGQTGGNLAADGTGPDGTPDGVVDGLDSDFWKSHFGQSVGSGSLGSAAVPEPAALWLAVAGMLAGGSCRRRR